MSNNYLSTEKRINCLAALAEGNSIRSIERMYSVHRDTVMRLGVRLGKGCARLLDEKMRGLSSTRIQVDEIWGFIGKKDKHVKPEDDPQLGSVWTFCAVDSDSKIVPSYRVGKRDGETANAFMMDLAGRLKNRIDLTSDQLPAYFDAVELAFGADVDYGQVVKSYVSTQDDKQVEKRYSPSKVVSISKFAITGNPKLLRSTTSHIERFNGTSRLHVKRLNRLTYAFSKKLENFEAAVAVHFAAYNFVRTHNSLKMTPAMAGDIEKNFWTWADLYEAVA